MTSASDVEVIDARLRELSRRLRRIEAKRPRSAKALAADEDLQDILARNLEVAIQTCIDVAFHLSGVQGSVPATAGDAFDELARRGVIERALAARLRRAVGLRNVLVHEYAEIDWSIVMQVLRTGRRDLAAFGGAVVKALDRKK
ncbi:MAG: type VII toxin-antitoxin system HepT family RNase toxin [Betaproteobacteria bacterium]